MNKPKDLPLECKVRGDVLTIRIGVDTLAFADKERTGVFITNTKGYAKDVVREICREDEIGAIPINGTLRQNDADGVGRWKRTY